MRLAIFNVKLVAGRDRLKTDQEQVLRGGWIESQEKWQQQCFVIISVIISNFEAHFYLSTGDTDTHTV